MKKRIFCFLLCAIVLVTSWMNVTPSTVAASSDEYTTNDVYDSTTLVENLKNGGKIVLWQDITTGQLTIEKDSTIDLNGYKLTVDGIVISEGKTFTIMDSQYTDDNPGSGKLITNGKEYMAGIQTTDATLIIESGVVEAIGSSGGAGIGGSGNYKNCAGTLIINAGTVIGTGGYRGAGIGGGSSDVTEEDGNGGIVTINKGGDGGIVTINGGIIIATGGNNAVGIGAGYGECDWGGSLVINDGMVKVDGDFRNHIGSSEKGMIDGDLIVNGGTLELTSYSLEVNMSNMSFKNCTVLCDGPHTISGKYNKEGKLPIKFTELQSYDGISYYQRPYGDNSAYVEFLTHNNSTDPTGKIVYRLNGKKIGEMEMFDGSDNYQMLELGQIKRWGWFILGTIGVEGTLTVGYEQGIDDIYVGDNILSIDVHGSNLGIDEKNAHSVFFIADDNCVYVHRVNHGQAATAPNINKAGHILSWDKEFDNITQDLIVNAIWTPIKYTVTFKDGYEIIEEQQVDYWTRPVRPKDPTKEGYTFIGWDNEYYLNSLITHDVELKAMWEKNKYKISTTYSSGGTISGGGIEEYNNKIYLIATPDDGYRFDGWYENGVKVSDNKSYSFIVTSNRNLEARFSKITPDSIIIDGEKQLEDMFIVECDKTLELTVLPNPYDAIIDETKVQWSTSDSTVATVENGIIRGIKQGQVTIKALYGGKQTSCIITVIPERTISCDECFGIGYEYIGCEKCSYDGKMPCPTCEGKGSIPKYEDCSKCGGDGKIFYSRTCEVCNGSGLLYNSAIGMYTCTECFEGTKYLNKTCSCIDGKVESGYPCEYCDGNKKIICKYCNGKKNYDRACEKCNATGEQKKAIYKIEYHANGGTNSPYAQIKTEDIKLQISNQIPVRENHIFLGWALKSSADEADYLPGDYILGNEPKILYAVWKEENILTSIGVTRMPFKVNYTEGEIFDSTGLIITAYFSSGVTQIISNYEITGYESTPGEKRIKVTYNDKTVEFSVVVKSKTVLSSISIAQMPYKVRYTEGEKFDSTGLIVTAHYSNNTTKNITGYGITGYESTPGEKKIKITYDNKTAYFTVTVKSKTLTSISIAQMPHKLNYVEGEVFKKDGLVVKANYSNNTSSNITTYQLTGYESTPGEKKIKITYDGKIAYFTITVKPKVPQAVTSGTYKVSGNVISKVTIGTTIKKLVSSINESKYVKVFKNQTEVKSDETISTGMMVNIMDGSTVAKSYKIIVTGDVNGDGNATVTDMLAIKAHILGKNKLSGEYATAADTSGDNAISITDFIQLKAKVLGKGSITAR